MAGNTPYIIMKYMDEFPTSSYLKKFKVVTLTESEIQGEDHITAGIDLGSYGYADC